VVTAQSENTGFYDSASVPEAAQAGFEETLGCGPSCVPDERNSSNVSCTLL
jgi:hypothetical protein